MFRELRRKKNAVTDETAKELLKESRRGVLAVIGDEGYPYAVPVNYLYDEENNKIYFHGARSGHKYDSIKANDKVCFTVYGNEIVKDEEWAPYLQSVVVFGRCHLLNHDDESMEILKKKILPKRGYHYRCYSIFRKSCADVRNRYRAFQW